jgi:Transcriptional accessory protein
VSSVPSHRALAMFRGRKEGLLSISLKEPEELNEDAPLKVGEFSPCAMKVAAHFGLSDAVTNMPDAADKWLKQVIYLTWKIKLFTSLELELFTHLREKSEATAIDVFADNLKDLLMSPPAGIKRVIGLDPGIRTG